METSEKALELLAQIVKWSREAALPNVRKRVDEVLNTETKRRVYDALKDGTITVRKLEDAGLGVGRETAQELLDEWDAVGLLEAGSNPPKAAFTLAELGIATPPPKVARGKNSTK